MNLIYSTEYGRMCPGCGKPVAKCACRRRESVPQGDGIVRVMRETKRRRGKSVTIISGLPLDHTGLRHLAKELKRRCGAGGTVKGATIEIQGEHWDMLLQELRSRGYTVKRAGG